MKLTKARLWKYQLPLQKNFAVKGRPFSAREGLLLQITDEQGHTAWGEAAPLPGFSKESLTQAQTELQNQLPELLDGELAGKTPEVQFKSFFEEKPVFSPSVCFALQSAILTLQARQEKHSLACLLDEGFQTRIRINAFIQGPKETAVKQAQALLAQGYNSLKIKVGAGDIAEDIEKVQAVNDVLRGKALLRVDANQAWDLPEAVEFGKAVGLDVVEYIEEPLKDVNQIPEFYNTTLLPSALDESLHSMDLKKMRFIEGVDVLVLKPTLLGGITTIQNLTAQARGAGLRVVISSAFESALGLRILAHVAAAFSHFTPAGLDTEKMFQKNVLPGALSISRGGAELADAALDDLPLNTAVLQPV